MAVAITAAKMCLVDARRPLSVQTMSDNKSYARIFFFSFAVLHAQIRVHEMQRNAITFCFCSEAASLFCGFSPHLPGPFCIYILLMLLYVVYFFHFTNDCDHREHNNTASNKFEERKGAKETPDNDGSVNA